MKKKILHIITGIGTGGAERVLCNLTFEDVANKHYVISLKKKNFVKTPYDFSHIDISYLDLTRYNGFYKFFYLIYLIFKIKPNIVQTWMYHADCFGGLAAKLAGINWILWNIRNSNIHKNTKFTTKLILKINIFLSYIIPNKIISCSYNAIKIHKNLGYKKIFTYIPNGFKLKKKFYMKSYFMVNPSIKKNSFIMSYVGRWHPQKDFMTLFRSLKILKNTFKVYNWKLLIAGYDLNKYNQDFYNLIKLNNLQKEVLIVGQVYDVNQIYQNSDLNILSSSFGEAFPNVILEAMANGTPCVATDVGECQRIISNNGWCVPIKNPIKFALAIRNAFFLKKNNKKWNKLKSNCEHSVNNRFSLNKMISNYHKLWERYF
jgi:glycosyltransferase involved in cell wall biosynthesis